jgi:hypothetical protein
MALLIRLDIDRPYGKRPAAKHILSRISSDYYFPKIRRLGYLSELGTILGWLNEARSRAYVFFRRCTLPSQPILELIEDGQHEIGLHLEDSRSFATFRKEREALEQHLGRQVFSFSKHGSGKGKFGFSHYPPYEPERYIEWAQKDSMKVFFGNLEDPTIEPSRYCGGLTVYPSAFWLEPPWRDTDRFPVDWLLDAARQRDVVLLVHPENVLADDGLVDDFQRIISALESRILV